MLLNKAEKERRARANRKATSELKTLLGSTFTDKFLIEAPRSDDKNCEFNLIFKARPACAYQPDYVLSLREHDNTELCMCKNHTAEFGSDRMIEAGIEGMKQRAYVDETHTPAAINRSGNIGGGSANRRPARKANHRSQNEWEKNLSTINRNKSTF